MSLNVCSAQWRSVFTKRANRAILDYLSDPRYWSPCLGRRDRRGKASRQQRHCSFGGGGDQTAAAAAAARLLHLSLTARTPFADGGLAPAVRHKPAAGGGWTQLIPLAGRRAVERRFGACLTYDLPPAAGGGGEVRIAHVGRKNAADRGLGGSFFLEFHRRGQSHPINLRSANQLLLIHASCFMLHMIRYGPSSLFILLNPLMPKSHFMCPLYNLKFLRKLTPTPTFLTHWSLKLTNVNV